MPRKTALVLSLAGAAFAGACQGPPVVPTPLPQTGVFAQIALQGGAVERAISGDAGCPDPRQAPYAIHVVVRMPATAPTTTDVYLFTYADDAAWKREEQAFETCRAEYAAGPDAAGRAVPHLDVSPYRAFGPGWIPEVEQALNRALEKSAAGG